MQVVLLHLVVRVLVLVLMLVLLFTLLVRQNLMVLVLVR